MSSSLIKNALFKIKVGYMFSRAWHWLHVFPRLAPIVGFPRSVSVACFPALGTGCMFSRAWHRLQVSRARYRLLVFPPLVPVACFPALGTDCRFPALGIGCLFSRPWYRLHVFPRLAPVARFPHLVQNASRSDSILIPGESLANRSKFYSY